MTPTFKELLEKRRHDHAETFSNDPIGRMISNGYKRGHASLEPLLLMAIEFIDKVSPCDYLFERSATGVCRVHADACEKCKTLQKLREELEKK